MPEVSVRGRRLAYEVQPVGLDKSSLSVVFIHGSGGDREDWRAQLDGLQQVGNIIALELPGHGESDPPGEATVKAYAQWTADFVDAMGLEKVVLVGCSLGSAITQWIALFNPKPWLVGIGLVGAGARLRVHPALLDGLRQDKEKALAMLSDFCLSPATGEPLRERLNEKYLKTPAELVHGDLSACNEFDVMDSIRERTIAHLDYCGGRRPTHPGQICSISTWSRQRLALGCCPTSGSSGDDGKAGRVQPAPRRVPD